MSETDAPRTIIQVPETFNVYLFPDSTEPIAYLAQTYKQARAIARMSIADWNVRSDPRHALALAYEAGK